MEERHPTEIWLEELFEPFRPTADYGRLVDEAGPDEVDPDTRYTMDDSGRGYGGGPR